MTRSPSRPLDGERVLIVEDRYFIAQELADEVGSLGGRVVGPARDLATAVALLSRETVEIALLDVNLDGEMVYPLADALAEQGVRIIFLTGYDAGLLPARWRDHPQLRKPVDPRQLCAELASLGSPAT